jgi:hypothetical protein
MFIGPTQLDILRKCTGGAAFECSRPAEYPAALKLNARGLIDRDPRRGMSHCFIGNAAGDAFIKSYDQGVLAA